MAEKKSIGNIGMDKKDDVDKEFNKRMERELGFAPKSPE